ncbi:MAG TPA: hypothetical protein VD713_03525 [Sphingomonadales bacterium]|nr:hypothetical protein [Sphingomonadales bacterium]
MKTLRTTLVSAATLGVMTVSFAGDALAEHNDRFGPRGKGFNSVDVYINAGPNRELERIIGEVLVRQNPNLNIVFSPRYADVTVKVNGKVSEPYREGRAYGRYGGGMLAMEYNYKIQVKGQRGRTLFRDRIRGQVTERVGRGYYHNGAYTYGEAEIAKDVFGILVDVIAGRRDDRYRQPYNVAEELRYEAYLEVARFIGRSIRIERRGWR